MTLSSSVMSVRSIRLIEVGKKIDDVAHAVIPRSERRRYSACVGYRLGENTIARSVVGTSSHAVN
jgi:hypothetical protein